MSISTYKLLKKFFEGIEQKLFLFFLLSFYMKVKPLYSDSLGVRSLSCLVETEDLKVFIDPSVSLGPLRYSLPPVPQEIEALEEAKQKIHDIAMDCQVLVISHYHFDHYDPEETFYTNKIVYAKDRLHNINKSQKERGSDFEEKVKGKVKALIYCDGKEFEWGKTKISFSKAFPHGPEGVRVGTVLITTIKAEDFTLVHGSDTQGPVVKEAADWIIKQKPDFLIMDGPPTLFLGWKFSKKSLEDASENLVRILKETNCEVILDHHLARDLKYKERFSEPYRVGKERVKTFAEYQGKENNFLEAHRKELWEKIAK
jgi:hypothetical protein